MLDHAVYNPVTMVEMEDDSWNPSTSILQGALEYLISLLDHNSWRAFWCGNVSAGAELRSFLDLLHLKALLPIMARCNSWWLDGFIKF
jgi:hypothetical protein